MSSSRLDLPLPARRTPPSRRPLHFAATPAPGAHPPLHTATRAYSTCTKPLETTTVRASPADQYLSPETRRRTESRKSPGSSSRVATPHTAAEPIRISASAACHPVRRTPTAVARPGRRRWQTPGVDGWLRGARRRVYGGRRAPSARARGRGRERRRGASLPALFQPGFGHGSSRPFWSIASAWVASHDEGRDPRPRWGADPS